MQIRPARECDYPAICQLVNSEEEMFFFHPGGKYPLNVEQLQQLASRRLELTVILDQANIIGFANLYNYIPSKQAFIGNVIIDRHYRGQALGQALLKHMLELALIKHKLPRVHLSVFSHNIPALLLYSALGFTPYAVEERKDFTGRRVALLHMQLPPPKTVT